MSGHLGATLAALVDGQLDHDARDRALAHVARCADCQTDVAEHRALKARLSALATPTMPGDMVLRLAALMAEPTAPSSGPGALVGDHRPPRASGGDFTSRPGVGRAGWSRFPRTTRPGTRSPQQPPEFSGRPGVAGGAGSAGGSGRIACTSVGSGPRPLAAEAAAGSRPRQASRPGRRRTTAVPAVAAMHARRNRMRTLVGASAVMLVAVAGGVTLADSRGPASPAQPVTAPSVRKVVPPASPAPPGQLSSVSFLPVAYVQVP